MARDDSLDKHFADVERIVNENYARVSEERRKQAESAWQKSYASSTGQPRKKRTVSRKEKAEPNFLFRKFIIILMCVLSLWGASKLIGSAFGALDNPTNMNNMNKQIGALVNTVDGPYDRLEESILSQNTRRNANGPYYLHDGIAKDLANLPPELFDYALAGLCYDMGPNIWNEVAHGGRTNIDGVIDMLDYYTDEPEDDYEAYIQEQIDDCEGIDDYLVKHGYVDKKGEPDLEAFVRTNNDNAENVYEFLTQYAQNKGVGLK